MATKYTFNFTDISKDSFDVQSYTSNGIKIPTSDVLLDRASQASTTLKIYGKGLPEYGEGVFQNMVYMLENYASGTIPRYSTEGQIWYNNVGTGTGSPTSGPELFIRKTITIGATEGLDIPTDWDAVILATGSSVMTGELVLAGAPTLPNHAVPLSLVTLHTTDFDIHLTTEQNTFLDTLDIVGSPPALTSADVNQLISITGNVQTLLDNKLSLDGGTMNNIGSPAANITFVGGEVLGLPDVPSANDASASKKYVDDQIFVGTGELTDIIWFAPPVVGSPPGSPLPVAINIDETSARYTITSPSTTTFLDLTGISRVGHTHVGTEVSIDNSFNTEYPTDTQSAFEFVDTEIQQLSDALDAVTGDITITLTVDRKFEILASDIIFGSPLAPYEVISHLVDDNNISITINGIKQYNHTHAEQNILYAININSFTPTFLDETIAYDFNVAVDGAPNVLVTIPAGTTLTTHDDLILAIDDVMNAASPLILGNLMFKINDSSTEAFYSTSSGTGSSILISDPVTANTYLFDIDVSPDAISGATFISDPSQVSGTGSPASIPDTIEILGDVSASFPVGQVFVIRGSDGPTYGTYDGTFSVHVNGVVVGGSPLTTTIPIAIAGVEDTNIALLSVYNPAGSPTPSVPAPAPFGSVYITPIANIDSVAAPIAGIEGDYTETDSAGLLVDVGDTTTHILFNYDILTGSKIETLKYS